MTKQTTIQVSDEEKRDLFLSERARLEKERLVKLRKINADYDAQVKELHKAIFELNKKIPRKANLSLIESPRGGYMKDTLNYEKTDIQDDYD